MSFKFDLWTLVGLSAQGLFFLRFIIQWYYSEKAKKTVIPNIFWYLSLLGAFLTIFYALIRKDIVFLITGLLQMVLYGRNLFIAKNNKKNES